MWFGYSEQDTSSVGCVLRLKYGLCTIFYNHTVILGPEAEQNSIIVISMAKWCPLENCTVLVLGSQYGIRLYDWDGSALFYKFDFVENGIGVDERQVTGKFQEFF